MKDFIKSKTFFIDVVIIILGCFIYSLGVNLFLTNAKLVSGGVTGVALILQYISNIQSGITVFLLNTDLCSERGMILALLSPLIIGL